MQLVRFQDKCLKELYDCLVYEGKQFISFIGPKGCGKSVIIEDLADTLKETWKVFLIAGTGKASPPYYTWYAAAHIPTLKEKKHIADISFGINFQPLGLPIGFEIGLGLNSEHSMFNGNEMSIITALNREANEDNILLIADDYCSWDEASKNLLHKIAALKTNIFLPNKSLHILLVRSTDDNEADMDLAESKPYKISIGKISFEEIAEIVNQQTYIKALETQDLENIVHFTGYDLRLINLAVRYLQKDSDFHEIYSLTDLLDKRISTMTDEHKLLCKVLEYVSIIDSFFSEIEAAYLLNQEPIHVEKILSEAVNLGFTQKVRNKNKWAS